MQRLVEHILEIMSSIFLDNQNFTFSKVAADQQHGIRC